MKFNEPATTNPIDQMKVVGQPTGVSGLPLIPPAWMPRTSPACCTAV